MKPRVAFFDFASCEGCQLQIANLEEEILDLIEIVDVVSFREVMKEHSDDYDIAIVEGSIIRPMDEQRLKKIRRKAKILIA
ncbi:MAG TPA: NADH:ubiquinone oxidoreductase, partial [Thermoplasmatales archaeon]|nr:NADH:ubiquinone oxidoreductase [Thermoplasmatales archaeon]